MVGQICKETDIYTDIIIFSPEGKGLFIIFARGNIIR